MGLLQAMDASGSELLCKLASDYRRAGLTDAQAADDLLAVIQLVPEVADEIPGFEKVAAGLPSLGGMWNTLRGAAKALVPAAKAELGATRAAAPVVAPRPPVPVSPVRAPLPSPFSNTPRPGTGQPGFRQPVGQYGPVAPHGPRLPPPSPLPPKPVGVMPTLRAAAGAMPEAFGTAARNVLGNKPVNALLAAPGAALNAVKAAPDAARGVWNETKPFLGSAAVGGGTGAVSGAASAAATGQDPMVGAVSGFAGGAGLGLMGMGSPRAAAGLGAVGGLLGPTATGTGLTGLAQAQLRTKVDPVLGTNLGMPRQFTDQDPALATSPAELEGAATIGGAQLNSLTPTMVTPEAQTALAQQKRQFADNVMAQAAKQPGANAAGALEHVLPGINDSVLGDPATATALATPQGRAQFATETDALEQQLLSANPGTLDPAKHGPQLATVAKRRMALAAQATGMKPAELAAKARQIEQNLTDGNLSAEDLQIALSTPAGQQFLQEYTSNSAAGAAQPGSAPAAAAPVAATPAPAAPAPTGAAPTADAPMDMGAIFKQIGGFAAENPAQFAALALGIPIALSGLAMSMTGGPSLGGILAMILGGGAVAGGLGQFGGTDLMSPLQQFFNGGAAPAAPPATPPVDPTTVAPPAAPTGGAAVPPAATFQLPDNGNAVNRAPGA